MISRLKKFLMKNPVRRGLALAFALLLYFQLSRTIDHNKDIISLDMPVNLILQDGLKNFSEDDKPKVVLKLHVPRNYTIRPGTVEVRAQAGSKNYNSASGRYQIELSRPNVHIADPKIIFSGFESGKKTVLSLNLIRSAVKDVPVRLRFAGSAPFGAAPKGVCLPQNVRVSGPENIVKELQDLSTAPIPLDGAPGDFEYETALQLPAGIHAVPARVNARIKLETNSVRRIFGIPVRILTRPGEARAELTTPLKNGVSVSLSGPGEVLARLTPAKIFVFADAAELSVSARRRVRLHCFTEEPGVTVTELLPGEIELKMTK